ncbi:hypothetical protein J2743_002106 [Methanobacterium petrolearium]|nr:hypothetical protein [Methanobacterium petrolearium]
MGKNKLHKSREQGSANRIFSGYICQKNPHNSLYGWA